MRKIGAYTQTCEVKEAVQAIPKSLTETISAFSNKEGGLIILGLSEKNDFKRECREFRVQDDYYRWAI